MVTSSQNPLKNFVERPERKLMADNLVKKSHGRIQSRDTMIGNSFMGAAFDKCLNREKP